MMTIQLENPSIERYIQEIGKENIEKMFLTFLEIKSEYQFPKKVPKFLGNVIQQFNVRNNRPTRGFEKWFEKINQSTVNKFVPELQKHSMILEKNCYEENYILAKIPNFNSLITYAQEHNKPVFTLTSEELNQVGTILKSSEEKVESFSELFSDLADKIISVTNEKC